MKRVVRWLKHLLTGSRKEEHRGLGVNHVATDWSGGLGRERKRWSFAKHRESGADGGARSWGQPAAATATAAAESPQARPKEDARAREEKAAVVIQKTFRGYLARRALRALRSLVKIQALVRGYLVRRQAAMTLHRLQTLMRLQSDSIAVKNASYRKSMEQEERIFGQEVRMKPAATPAHRRRLSDSTDSNYERSPRIVEMDTCHLRSRSSRMTSRYNPDHHSSEYHRLAAPTPSCSPLPGGKQQPARLSFRRSTPERDPRGSKTAHNTPRLAPPSHDSSPAKSVEHSLPGSTPRRASPRDRDALVSPRYMAGTASSAARTRCHSAPRQRQTVPPAEAPRSSVTSRAGASRRPCPHARGGGLCAQCSDATRAAGCSGIGASDEVARDYYLNSFW
ncbi:protein IQ-DOMAIN 14-like [Panicum miliaceum]|uniref:Protein IQ-DOMAIN 14-like n=1 Tax=Panicum miliaceum TaxID=4540 RepID=A0A3L6SS70_PANMI|nr:protein IQ-DOMAIN 14-like [Panicum miliaceum]